VPGVSGAAFSWVGLPAIHHSGQLAFRASLSGTGLNSANNTGIFSGADADSLQLIARAGDPLPQAPGFVISTVGTPQINAAGQMIFAGTIEGPGEPSEPAIFGYDPQAGLRILIRAGDLLGPAQARQVLSVSLDADSSPGATDSGVLSGGEDGLGSNLNNAGQFAFLATLTDGQTVTSGVFVGSVPEPAAALFCIAILSCAVLGRQHPPQ